MSLFESTLRAIGYQASHLGPVRPAVERTFAAEWRENRKLVAHGGDADALLRNAAHMALQTHRDALLAHWRPRMRAELAEDPTAVEATLREIAAERGVPLASLREPAEALWADDPDLGVLVADVSWHLPREG